MVRGIFLSKYWVDRLVLWKDFFVFLEELFIYYIEEMLF